MSGLKIAVSACLLGVCCRYDGQSRPHPEVIALAAEHELIPICPEQLGGLPTPRPASERCGDRVVNREGVDVSEQYARGARETLRLCRLMGCSWAILKEKSPSCGSGRIYDGSFSGRLTGGDGVTAALLRENGIRVIGESELSVLRRSACEPTA